MVTIHTDLVGINFTEKLNNLSDMERLQIKLPGSVKVETITFHGKWKSLSYQFIFMSFENEKLFMFQFFHFLNVLICKLQAMDINIAWPNLSHITLKPVMRCWIEMLLGFRKL